MEHLVASILDSSESIRPAFRGVTLVTNEGRTVSGLVARETPETIVVREPGAATIVSGDGDVWTCGGLASATDALAWRRIASGLFQPLGIRVIHGAIHVGCRDRIVVLRDLDGDGCTDRYDTFNDDHQVTEHFHEFAIGLETDAAGNLYYAKSARQALPAVVPHRGTLFVFTQESLCRTPSIIGSRPR